jgi:hypothetical protein
MSNGAIPDDPSTVPTSTWRQAFIESPAGREVLYGTHDPDNYRVIYKCSTAAAGDTSLATVPGPAKAGASQVTALCPPNPKKDADGDYVDGAYVNEDICGPGGICEPSSVVWADRAEDEMCIMVGHYYPLDRIGDMEGGGHDRAMGHLTSGDPDRVDEVGTPGTTRNQDVVGRCWDCKEGL